MKIAGAALFLFAALSLPAHAADPATVAKCEACHGLHGDSTSSTVPRLNGQQPDYLRLRLREFLDPTRGTPHATYQMWETATELGDRTATELSQYFGSQAPTPAAPQGALAAKGAAIYREGAGPNAPACQTCHGAAGEGHGTAPRLAGQHAEYLSQQLNAFMFSLRVHETMNPNARHLDADQIKALTAYLANH